MNRYHKDEDRKEVPPVFNPMGSFKKTNSFARTVILSKSFSSLKDRIKSISKRDVAFVLAGLSILVMAPLASFFLSKPSTDNLLTPGFGSREPAPSLSLYEPGMYRLSTGSPDGTADEIITPLSVRDPLSLILGPQSSAPPPTPAPVSDFRDSMKEAAKSAFGQATQSAGAPTPIPRMQSSLRGFGSFFGGGESTRTGATLQGGKILESAKAASAKAAKRTIVGPQAMPGYKGVAQSIPQSASRGAYDRLRHMADRAAGYFPGEGAVRSLEKAAGASQFGDGTGGMGLGDGGKDGKFSDSNVKGSKSVNWEKPFATKLAEKLAETEAMERLKKALEWEFFLKYDIPKQIIQAFLDSIVKDSLINKFIKGKVDSLLGNTTGGGTYYCYKCLKWSDEGPCSKWSLIGQSDDEKTIDAWKAKGLCDWLARTPPGGGGTVPSPTPMPTPTPTPTPPVTQPSPPPQPGETVKNYYEKVDALLKAAYDFGLEAGKKLSAQTINPSQIPQLSKELNEGVLENLKNATLECGKFSAELKPNVPKLQELAKQLDADAQKISSESSASLPQSAQGKRKVQTGVITFIPSDKIPEFDKIAEGCSLDTSGDDENSITNKINQARSINDYAPELMRCRCYVDNSRGYLNTAIDSSRRISISARNVKGQSIKIGEVLDLQDKNMSTIIEGLGGYSKKINHDLQALQDPQLADAAKKELIVALDDLIFKGTQGSKQPQQQSPTSSVSGPTMLAYSNTTGYRDAVSDKSQDKSVMLLIRDIIGRMPEKPSSVDGQCDPLDDLCLESRWWNENNPFAKEKVQFEDENGRALIRLAQRIGTTYKEMETYNKIVVQGTMGRIEYAKQLTDDAIKSIDSLLNTGVQPAPVPPGEQQSLEKEKSLALEHLGNTKNDISYLEMKGTADKNSLLAFAQTHPQSSTRVKEIVKLYDTRVDKIKQELNALENKIKNATNLEDIKKYNEERSKLQARMNEAVSDLSTEYQNLTGKPSSVTQFNIQQTQTQEQGQSQQQAQEQGQTQTQKPKPKPEPQPKPKRPEPAKVIDSIRLIKGQIEIPAYDQEGKPVMGKECIKWGVGVTSVFTGKPVCKEYKPFHVRVKVNDYYIAYRGHKGDSLPLPLTGGAAAADGDAYYQDESIKRQEYDMEVKVICRYEKSLGGWVMKYAGLRKGLANSADSLGGMVGASFKPLGVGVDVRVSYQHTWNRYRHGVMEDFSNIVRDQPCK